MKIPRWLELQEEIDYLYFCLDQIRRKMPKTGLDKLIDETTGYDKARLQDAADICLKMKELKAEWAKETGREATTEMEDQIISLLPGTDTSKGEIP